MTAQNSIQILNHIYGVMLEINYLQKDSDILEELTNQKDDFVEKQLLAFKRISSKYKAEWNKQKFQKALSFLNDLKSKGEEEINKILKPKEQIIYAPLFRKFEELTEKDKESIFEDQDLLDLIDYLSEQDDD